MKTRLLSGFLLASLLLLAGALLTMTAFRTPVESLRTVTDLSADVETTFTHRVLPLLSALYPEPAPLENQPFFYMRLLDQLSLQVDTAVTLRPAAHVEGTAEILVRVVAPERWERSFVLQPARPFRSAGPVERVAVFQDTFPIDLSQYQDFIAMVEEETRVMPRGDYQVVVVPVVEFRAWRDGSGASSLQPEVQERFEFPFAFTLAGNTLMPQQQLSQGRSAAASRTVTEPGVVRLAGLSLGVRAARLVGLVTTGAAAVLVLVLGGQARRTARSQPEAQRIRRRYRARLLSVRPDAGPVITGSVVPLAAFQDLLRVADQLEQPVLMVPGEDVYRFAVVGERVTYVYEAAAGPQEVGEAAD